MLPAKYLPVASDQSSAATLSACIVTATELIDGVVVVECCCLRVHSCYALLLTLCHTASVLMLRISDYTPVTKCGPPGPKHEVNKKMLFQGCYDRGLDFDIR